MEWTNVKRSVPIIGIILLSVLFRFVYLDRIPAAISGDELHYAITAKAIWLTGRDITGTWNPLSAFLFRYPPNEQQAELPYFLHLPFSGPFPFSLLLAKLPFAILSIGIVILLYCITRKLFGNTAGIATGLIAAVNPWLVVMGRTGYESTPATFFYLLAIWVLLTTNSWGILWSLVPLLLAFYSYIGTKLILIPFVILTVILVYRKGTRGTYKPYIVLILASIVLTAGYLVLLTTSPAGSRISELVLPSSPAVAARVNEIRQTSIQSPLLPLFVNKYTAYVQIISSKLFRIFSPAYLFVEGDRFFLPASQSFFYYVDFLFAILGALVLFTKKRKYFFILIGLIFIGTVPHLVHTTMGDFSGHLALMFPFIVIMTGVGVAGCVDHFKGRLRAATLVIIGFIYTLNVVSFSMIYFLQYPLVGSGDFPMRILSNYVTLARQTHTAITIYSTRRADLLTKYLFYSNSESRNSLPEISHLETNQPFTFNQIRFTDCDPGVTRTNAPAGILIFDQNCTMNINSPTVKISSLLDGGQQYKILNDTVCGTYNLNPYPSGITIRVLGIEQLSQAEFCKHYISN